jgi:hypothetical protein
MTQKPAKPASRAKREPAATAPESTKPAAAAKRATAARGAEPAKPAAAAKRATAATAAEPAKPAAAAKRATPATAAEPAKPAARTKRAPTAKAAEPAKAATARTAAPAKPAGGPLDPSTAPTSGRSPTYDEISQRAYFIALEGVGETRSPTGCAPSASLRRREPGIDTASAMLAELSASSSPRGSSATTCSGRATTTASFCTAAT